MNTVDTVMTLLSSDPTLHTPKDTDAIIDYYRSKRGVKIVKEEGPKLELTSLIDIPKPKVIQGTMNRRGF